MFLFSYFFVFRFDSVRTLSLNVPAAWRSGGVSIVATLSSGMFLIS
ncbi:MAG: hypothetical protein LBP96_05615 [Bacteroidales bacterium]|nr:hypothetical protein [Bacteroidales bacterium]